MTDQPAPLDVVDIFHTEYRDATRGRLLDDEDKDEALQQALEAVEHAIREDERQQFVRRITEYRESLNFDELLDRVAGAAITGMRGGADR